MKSRTWKKLETVASFAAFMALSASSHATDRLLNRSIYVPIRFSACEHLSQGILFVNDQPVGRLPLQQILQFTYYPKLKRMIPDVTLIRIEGVRIDGEPFIARLAVSPKEITTAHERIDLRREEQLKKLSFKIDVRYERRNLLIRCGEFCGKALDEAPSPETMKQRVEQ